MSGYFQIFGFNDAVPFMASLESLTGSVSLLNFIPQEEHEAILNRTSTYDCLPAMKQALALFYSVVCPFGEYRFSGTINIKRPNRIQGAAGCLMTENAPDPVVFSFPQGVVGIIVHRRDTDGDDEGNVRVLETDTTGGDGASIDRIVLKCDRFEPGPYEYNGKHGIWLKARAEITRTRVHNFYGDGFHIYADAGDQPADTRGNANCWATSGCSAYGNAGWGLFVCGADANAGTCTGLDASYNWTGGIYDASFLGNTYIGCHTSGNQGAPYKTSNVNARNLFIGCYTESGQPPVELNQPGMAIGGCFDIEGTNIGNGTILQASQDGLLSSRAFTAMRTFNRELTVAGVSNGEYDRSLLFFQHTRAPTRFKYEFKTNGEHGINLAFGYGNAEQFSHQFIGPESSFTLGRSTPPVGAMLLHRAFFGSWETNQTYGQHHFSGYGPPTYGEWGRGDTCYTMAPEPGGFEGWKCVEAGSPGVWKPFGRIEC